MKLVSIVLFLSGCVSEQAVRGNLYMHDGLPYNFCAQFPEVKNYGIYRVVKCTDTAVVGCEQGQADYEEVIPYCSPRVKNFLSADKVHVEEWLRNLRKPK